jgi:Gas vesicle synthesis protein GvpL/GvpF
MSGDTGLWTYAVTEDGHLSGPDGPVDLSWLTGVGEAPVRTTASGGMTALVSDVSLAEFGETVLRENLDDLDWLNEVAREHHYVIDAAARLFPLLPVRLATVYSSDDAVHAALAERGSRLRDALHRVGGRVEWGVKAYAPQQPDEVHAGPQPKVTVLHLVEAVHADLAARAADTRLHPPQFPQLNGLREAALLNAAYLLDAADGVRFTAAVAGQATAHPELRVELTGPWPPYSFAADVDDEH